MIKKYNDQDQSMHVLAFQKKVLRWYHRCGRKNLPWQLERSPYRVWISEIMLQQTGVKTVIPYFERFIAQFPTLHHLANASMDEILYFWSGLGYYARAKNLYRCAQYLVNHYQGVFPKTLKELQTLPGVGRSTAGAILSFGLNRFASILDGNIKRLLTRYYPIDLHVQRSRIEKQLWDLAEQCTPQKNFIDYSQAMMDIGATICLPRKPICTSCPLRKGCQSIVDLNRIKSTYARSKKVLPIRSTYFLIIQNNAQEILLQKRPPVGIWSNLWCFPQCDLNIDWIMVVKHLMQCDIRSVEKWSNFRHTFTHFYLDIYPIIIRIQNQKLYAMETDDLFWYAIKTPLKKGIPRPVSQLLQRIFS